MKEKLTLKNSLTLVTLVQAEHQEQSCAKTVQRLEEAGTPSLGHMWLLCFGEKLLLKAILCTGQGTPKILDPWALQTVVPFGLLGLEEELAWSKTKKSTLLLQKFKRNTFSLKICWFVTLMNRTWPLPYKNLKKKPAYSPFHECIHNQRRCHDS